MLLTLPTGQVSVEYACTGGPLIVWLLKPSLLMVILFTLTFLQRLGLALSAITRKLLRRGSFSSQADLKQQILNFIDYFNQKLARPFQWTFKGKLLAA